MPVTFNGVDLTITLDPGVGGLDLIDAQTDLYEPWKDWQRNPATNMGFPQAFGTSGGVTLAPGLTSGAYFSLRNDLGWRIKFPENDLEVTLSGNLIPVDSALPMTINSDGVFRNVLFGLQPITQNVALLLDDIQFVRQVIAGRAVVSLDDLTITIYETDGLTVLVTFDISADGRIRTPT